MSSVSRQFSQRASKNFLTMYTNVYSNNIPFFLESDINNWVAANSQYVTRVGSVITVTGALVTSVLRGQDGPYTEMEHSGDNINVGKTVNNMGKTIVIGSPTESEYLVLTRVQVPGGYAAEGGNGAVGYVVTDNNCSDLTRPRFQVCVASV